MKKILLIGCLVVVILGVIICLLLFHKGKEYYITDHEHLYDAAVAYLIENDTNPEKNRDRYKMFAEYEGFGITEDNEYRYAYLWISESSYYVKNNQLISGSGSSMPYKFTFLKDEVKVVCYEIPMDGSEYVPSIRKMFPKNIAKKVLKYQYQDDRLMEEVKEYYSDLEDPTIYFTIGDSYTFDGEIYEAGKDYILVKVLEDSDLFHVSDKVKVAIKRPTSGVADFYVPGNRVRIYFNGNINESDPMQIGADKVELIS